MIETFADKHRLRLKADECRDKYVPARYGQIYADGSNLAVMFIDGPEGTHRLTMRSRIRRAVEAGFSVSQMGDGEAVLYFTPEQSKLAIKLVGARKSKKGIAVSTAGLERHRQSLKEPHK